jgi:hypothetical protein
MVLIVVPFFFLFPLMGWGLIGLAIFAGSIAVGVVLAIRVLFLWNADVLVVTNLRLVDVDQKGVLSRRVAEVAYDAIEDVSWQRKGVWQTIFRMGSVGVQTAGQASNLDIQKIPHPDKLHDLILDAKTYFGKTLVKKDSQKQLPQDRRSRLRRIAQLLDQVDDEIVSDVLAVLERESKKRSMEKLFEEQNTEFEDEDEADDEDDQTEDK